MKLDFMNRSSSIALTYLLKKYPEFLTIYTELSDPN